VFKAFNQSNHKATVHLENTIVAKGQQASVRLALYPFKKAFIEHQAMLLFFI